MVRFFTQNIIFLRISVPALFALALLAFLCSSCAEQPKTTTLDVALTDGTHTGGVLLAIDYNWLVLDASDGAEDAPLTLLDYGLIDTITIVGNHYEKGGAVLGGIAGTVTGILLASDFDSTRLATERTRSLLGLGAGLVAGAAVGYLVGDIFSDSDTVFPHPDDSDYSFLRERAVYPDSLPPELKFTLDSVDRADSIAQL